MRQDRTSAHKVQDSDVPGGLDVAIVDSQAEGTLVELNDGDNTYTESTPWPLFGGVRVNDNTNDGSTIYFDNEHPDKELLHTITVENRGGTSGGGPLGDGNPDSCADGDGTRLKVVWENAESSTWDGYTFAGGDTIICVPDNGILKDPGVGNFGLNFTGSLTDRQIGDKFKIDVWVEGANTGTRVTPKYRLAFMPAQTVKEDYGSGDGDDDQTEDGGGGGGKGIGAGSDFTVTNREWFEEDGEIVVSVTIEGGDGGVKSVPATYYIDGNEFDSGFLAGQGITEGDTETDEGDIDLAEIEPGDHLLEVEVGDAGVLEVDTITVEEQPSGDPAQQLSIENCDAGKFGSGAAVSADIANSSEFPITADVEILVDGQAEATIEAVSIAGGQSQPISQQVPIPSTPDDYVVSIQTVNETFN